MDKRDELIEKLKEYNLYLKTKYHSSFKIDQYESEISALESEIKQDQAIPHWYTRNEMYNYLRKNQYSDEIATELADKYADDLQHAFIKGWEKAKYELIKQEQIPKDLDNPWTTTDVLAKLIWAAEYLLNKKSYDGHNYEEIETCVRRGKELISKLDQINTKQDQIESPGVFFIDEDGPAELKDIDKI